MQFFVEQAESSEQSDSEKYTAMTKLAPLFCQVDNSNNAIKTIYFAMLTPNSGRYPVMVSTFET